MTSDAQPRSLPFRLLVVCLLAGFLVLQGVSWVGTHSHAHGDHHDQCCQFCQAGTMPVVQTGAVEIAPPSEAAWQLPHATVETPGESLPAPHSSRAPPA